MKNNVMINMAGKKIHTLVKENTPYGHAVAKIIHRNVVSLKRSYGVFLHNIVCLSHCCSNNGRKVTFMLSNTYQETYT